MKFPLSLLENICKFVSVTLILSIVDFAHSKLLPFNRFKSNHTNHFNHESVRSMRKVPINFGVETIHRWHVWRALRSTEVIDASAMGRNRIRKMASFSVLKPQCSGYEVHIYPPRLTRHDTESWPNKSPHHTFTVCKKRKVYFPSCASVS